MKSLLSVIIPVYNVEKYIGRCLTSICKQTYTNIQIIIVDDGSTDSSFDVCNKYKELDSRIELYKQNNSGVSSARNFGITKAKGDYITFVDADDYLDIQAYEIVFDQIGDCDAAYFGFYEYYENSDHLKIVSPSVTGKHDKDSALYECLLPLSYYASVWNKVFKTSHVKKCPFDETIKIGEDELWLVQISKAMNNVMLIGKPLYYYVQTENSAMRSEYKITPKWISSIEEKYKVLELLKDNEKCYEVSKAKAYNDTFHTKWYAYVSDDMENYKMINNFLKPYKKSFFRNKEFGTNRKIKFALLDFMMKMRFPSSLVIKIGESTSYKIKVFLEERKKI